MVPVISFWDTELHLLLVPGVKYCTCNHIYFGDINKIFKMENWFTRRCYQKYLRKGFQKYSLTNTFRVTFGFFFSLVSSVSTFSKTWCNIFPDISPDCRSMISLNPLEVKDGYKNILQVTRLLQMFLIKCTKSYKR